MGIILLVFLAEVGAGVASNSLALFSDAGHTFMDLFSYGIAYAALTAARRKANQRETFGGHRAEIVAAFVSGILLLFVVVVIYLEALQRLVAPEVGNLSYMLTVPLLPIAANLYLARRFEGARDLNMRAARMHVLSDLFSALGVLGAGVVILATGNWVFDPLASFFIGYLILRGAIELLRDSVEILLERAPAHLKVPDLVVRIQEVPGVVSVHAVHAWSLCSTVHALSAHLVTSATGAEARALLDGVHRKLESDFAIAYTTIQLEREPCGAEQHPTVHHTEAEAIAQAQAH
jgi:cobalt-zinc-cadmium efflux system protein